MLPLLVAIAVDLRDQLRDVSNHLRNLADAVDALPVAFNGNFRALLFGCIEQVAVLVARGTPDFEAAVQAAAGTGIDPFELQRSWMVHKKRRAAQELHARRMLVQMLTEQHWKDADIARVLSVHVKHIPRMRRALKGPKEAALHEGQRKSDE